MIFNLLHLVFVLLCLLHLVFFYCTFYVSTMSRCIAVNDQPINYLVIHLPLPFCIHTGSMSSYLFLVMSSACLLKFLLSCYLFSPVSVPFRCHLDLLSAILRIVSNILSHPTLSAFSVLFNNISFYFDSILK